MPPSRTVYAASVHQQFVNALRACLDLEPLYDRSARSEVERFARTFPERVETGMRRPPISRA